VSVSDERRDEARVAALGDDLRKVGEAALRQLQALLADDTAGDRDYAAWATALARVLEVATRNWQLLSGRPTARHEAIRQTAARREEIRRVLADPEARRAVAELLVVVSRVAPALPAGLPAPQSQDARGAGGGEKPPQPGWDCVSRPAREGPRGGGLGAAPRGGPRHPARSSGIGRAAR
jgi:hypothetical protein